MTINTGGLIMQEIEQSNEANKEAIIRKNSHLFSELLSHFLADLDNALTRIDPRPNPVSRSSPKSLCYCNYDNIDADILRDRKREHGEWRFIRRIYDKASKQERLDEELESLLEKHKGLNVPLSAKPRVRKGRNVFRERANRAVQEFEALDDIVNKEFEKKSIKAEQVDDDVLNQMAFMVQTEWANRIVNDLLQNAAPGADFAKVLREEETFQPNDPRLNRKIKYPVIEQRTAIKVDLSSPKLTEALERQIAAFKRENIKSNLEMLLLRLESEKGLFSPQQVQDFLENFAKAMGMEASITVRGARADRGVAE
jgi:hypothetical protein